jgi:hypothetical protein
MSDVTPEPRPAAAWAQVLGRIEDTLGQSLALAETSAAPPPGSESAPAARSPLQVLDDRLAGLQAALDQAEANAAEADALLVEASGTLEQWVGGAQAAGRRLADWAAGAV